MSACSAPSKYPKRATLANWTTEDPAFPPGIGGAMDLAVGAREIRIIMEHTSKKGEPRILRHCTYPHHRGRLRQAHLHQPCGG